jgi:hypothetical protein
VGVALDANLTASAWHRSVIEEIQASEVARISTVLLVAPVGKAATRDGRSGPTIGGWAWRLYRQLDARRAATLVDPCAITGVADLVGSLPSVEVPAVEASDAGVEPLGVEPLADRVAREGLDVVVDLATFPVPSSVGSVVRAGVWAFRAAGDDRAEFEMLSGASATSRVSLVRRADDVHPGRTLATSTFASDAGSVARYRAQAYFGATHLVVAELRRLHDGVEPVHEEPGDEHPLPRAASTPPASADVIRWIMPLVARKAVDRVTDVFHANTEVQHWQVGYRTRPPASGDGAGPLDLTTFTWIDAPDGRFYADPFLLERDGRTWMFIEDCSYASKRGTIAVAEVQDDGRVAPFTEVIRSDGHLSYPYVFEADGEVFMIPESSAESEVRLYRATSFPFRWELTRVLHRGRAVDTSVVRHDGRWWFFTTLVEPRGHASMMMLFSSETLDGGWSSHPMNPVSRDVRNIRGAGAIRPTAGRLVRPSQDCSRSYGYAFSWKAVDVLDEGAYHEQTLGRVEPCERLGMTATHTYNASARWETVDGRFIRSARTVAR